MTDSLLQQGLNLMSFGMGTVFVFLAVLVATTVIMSRVIGRFFPGRHELAGDKPPANRQSAAANTVIDDKVLKVIQAALNQHRNKK